MPRTNKCTFCGRSFRQGTGLLFVEKNGGIFYLCSSKCKKSQLILKRDPRKLKWTEYYGKKEKGS